MTPENLICHVTVWKWLVKYVDWTGNHMHESNPVFYRSFDIGIPPEYSLNGNLINMWQLCTEHEFRFAK